MDVRMPDGTVVQNVPDDITQSELSRRYSASKAGKPLEWSAVPGQALRNLPSSAASFAGGLYQAVRHPIDTASGMMDILAGGLRNLAPEAARGVVDKADWNPEAAQRASQSADAVGEVYKQRYGGIENLKRTIATDPVGALGDASMVLGGGGALASKGASIANMPRVAKAASAVANVGSAINPVSLGVDALKAGGKLAGGAASQVLGLSTGAGAESVKTSARAGLESNPDFMKNLTGKVSSREVLEQAKQALQTMRDQRSANYQSGIATTAADVKPLNFAPIDEAFSKTLLTMKTKGHWLIDDPAEFKTIKKIQKALDEWRSDPSVHDAIGLDALKRRLDAIYPDSPAHKNAQRAVTATRNAVKDTIVKQSPEYAKTMADYEMALTVEREIERALSLGNKASEDTAIRKLQSLMRNNANTNYGHRLELAKTLQDASGQNLMPALAGQAMSSWTPRGLPGQGAGLASMLTGSAWALPFLSPKAMGTMAYGGGKVAGGLLSAGKGSYLSPEELKWAALISAKANQ